MYSNLSIYCREESHQIHFLFLTKAYLKIIGEQFSLCIVKVQIREGCQWDAVFLIHPSRISIFNSFSKSSYTESDWSNHSPINNIHLSIYPSVSPLPTWKLINNQSSENCWSRRVNRIDMQNRSIREVSLECREGTIQIASCKQPSVCWTYRQVRI